MSMIHAGDTEQNDAGAKRLVLARANLPIPGESDFGLSPDASDAWRTLGGLSLDAAYDKFLE